MQYPRRAAEVLDRYLASARGAVVNGPRQAGKTSLLRQAHAVRGGSYVSLDDRTELRAARTDPVGFVAERARPLILDEVQRGGDPLLLALKVSLDARPDAGQVVSTSRQRLLPSST